MTKMNETITFKKMKDCYKVTFNINKKKVTRVFKGKSIPDLAFDITDMVFKLKNPCHS